MKTRVMNFKEFIDNVPVKKASYSEVLIAMAESKQITQQKPTEYQTFNRTNPLMEKKPEKRPEKRQAIPWTQEEVDAIEDGVKKYGIGHWTLVYELHKDIFMKNERKSSDVGDKWKNMKTKPQYQKYITEDKKAHPKTVNPPQEPNKPVATLVVPTNSHPNAIPNPKQ
ncbi:telomeric DNA binding protein, putative [Trichomonas vaginalis G3]|uniref:Telomeric DNA binding protein, putative n=1 Tax=Trichomonas vaginalis (strain ATCC PRA-98 / G3) TaxID=412133 RepID=A2EXV6_TRIV3|nr:SANT/myb-like telomere repeat binding factor-like DNA-binding domain-containing protein [Trichomonas vaginalis G3]EAY02489.1 telomeric DNA binding protein, putative [Trichomonas vaginalis G3]KAI5529065.1 SANT/myb-like telomere repeat binding factor-like DNA-binding domain-containing protein [Trichomonas vaginalis G3]|eukprot:XP_001314728.1 telomeric DNA binding protein [Trichomonas vaginalis G3]